MTGSSLLALTEPESTQEWVFLLLGTQYPSWWRVNRFYSFAGLAVLGSPDGLAATVVREIQDWF
jgi:hypothetical protein